MRSYFTQSIAAILKLVEEGLFGPARRELRFLLESAVKFIVIDIQNDEMATSDRLNLLEHFKDKFPKIVDLYSAPMHVDISKGFNNELKSLYGGLSVYVHTSKKQVEKDFCDFEKGQYIGFEDISTLRRFISLAFQVYDVVLVMFTHSIGIGLAGDIFLQYDNELDWVYHKGKYMKAFNAFYDYKAERNNPDYWKDKNPARYQQMLKNQDCS